MKDEWYVATILVRCRVGDKDEESWTCEEQIHVLRATDPEKALDKALALGKEQDQWYKNMYEETV